MKTPKRKAPEKKPARQSAGPAFGVGAAALGVVAARPGLSGGVLVFTIVFGMISANALWYQPGGHPSPLLRTRDAGDQHLLFGFQRSDEPANVTTFRIERPEPAVTNSTGNAPGGVADVVKSATSDLVRGVQEELTRLNHYQGAADGLAGPRTAAAILAYQKAAGLPETGEASDTLLAALKAARTPVPQAPAAVVAPKVEEKPVAAKQPAPKPVAVPPARPTVLPAKAQAPDPVADAIRKAEKMTPPASIPNVTTPDVATPVRLQATSSKADAAMVMKIQRGLSKFAYSNVPVDGVAGASTRDAIRNFEKAYRLPETGAPNERVLKKLKEIGAL